MKNASTLSQNTAVKIVGFFFLIGLFMVLFSRNKQAEVEISTEAFPTEPVQTPLVISTSPSTSSSPTPAPSSTPKPKISRIAFVNWPALDGGRSIDKVVLSYACDVEFRRRYGPQVEVVLIPLENNFLLQSDDLLFKALRTSQLVYINAADVLDSSSSKEILLKKVFEVTKKAGPPIWVNIDRISSENAEWLRTQHIHWISVKTEDAHITLLSQAGFKQPDPEETEHEAEFRWNEVDFEDQADFDIMLDENGVDESTLEKEVHKAADFAFLLPYQPAMSRDQWMIQHSIWDRQETVKVLLNGQLDDILNENFFRSLLGLIKKQYLRAVFRVVSDFQDSEIEENPITAPSIKAPEYVYPATIAEALWFYSRASVVLTTGSYGGILARLTSTPAVFIPASTSVEILEFAAGVNSPAYAFVDVKLQSTAEERAQAVWETIQRVLSYAEEHSLKNDGTVPRFSDSALDNFPMSHKKGDVDSLPTIIDDVEMDRQRSFHAAADTAAYQISKKQVPMLKFDKSRNQYLVKPMT